MKKKKTLVRQMFDDIAPTYDLLNRVLSLGIDKKWRKKLVNELKNKNIKLILDVATGTGDLAMQLTELKPEKVFGMDIAKKMLVLAQKKTEKRNLSDLIEFIQGDAENIPFEDNYFDLVTCAFGVRNFENLKKGLKEFYRVLKPGGFTAILEFSSERNKIFDFLFKVYFHKFLPFFGKIISKNKTAYEYLPQTVEAFYNSKEFCKILKQTGFKCLKKVIMTFGIAVIYIGQK